MDNANTISVEQCCIHYRIETSFVMKLGDYGLIELIRTGGESFIAYEQLSDLERYMHLHYDLEINMEGIEAIHHLLNRMQHLQQEIKKLQSGQDKN